VRTYVEYEPYTIRPDIITKASLIGRHSLRCSVTVNETTLVSVQPPDNRYFPACWSSPDTDFIVVFRKKGSSRWNMTATKWWVFIYNWEWKEASWDDLTIDQQAIVIRRIRGQFDTFTGLIPWSESLEGLIALESL